MTQPHAQISGFLSWKGNQQLPHSCLDPFFQLAWLSGDPGGSGPLATLPGPLLPRFGAHPGLAGCSLAS